MSAKFIQICNKIKFYSIAIGISGFFILGYLPGKAQNISNNNPNVVQPGYSIGYMSINSNYLQNLDSTTHVVGNNLKSTQYAWSGAL